MDMHKIAQMSCNPAIGGIAKGQIVREIDALGGYCGIVTDMTAIQYRMLNRSKGPAMWSPRSQADRQKFSEKWRSILENTENVGMINVSRSGDGVLRKLPLFMVYKNQYYPHLAMMVAQKAIADDTKDFVDKKYFE